MDQITIEARFEAIELRVASLETLGGIGGPALTALQPASAVIGAPSFTLHVYGAHFTGQSVIVFAGHDEPTTLVSAQEVTTGVDMDFWHGADALPVAVRSGDGQISNPLTFTFTMPSETAALEQRIAALEAFERRIADLEVEPVAEKGGSHGKTKNVSKEK